MTTDARPSLFPDVDLVEFVTLMYGQVMGRKCEEIFAADPENGSGFANSIRRSLTHDIDQSIQSGRLKPSDWGHRG